jgi:hypothetical protein
VLIIHQPSDHSLLSLDMKQESVYFTSLPSITFQIALLLTNRGLNSKSLLL